MGDIRKFNLILNTSGVSIISKFSEFDSFIFKKKFENANDRNCI